jgi:hypothetical protein
MAEHETIKSILLELGLWSLATACVGSERELFRLFQDDFEGLVKRCQP